MVNITATVRCFVSHAGGSRVVGSSVAYRIRIRFAPLQTSKTPAIPSRTHTWHAVACVGDDCLVLAAVDYRRRVRVPRLARRAGGLQQPPVRCRPRTRCPVVPRRTSSLRRPASHRSRTRTRSRRRPATPVGQVPNYCPKTHLRNIRKREIGNQHILSVAFRYRHSSLFNYLFSL